MPDFAVRCDELEIMDGPAAHTEALYQALRELELINRWLGGNRVVVNALDRLIHPRDEPWRIVDFGCGGGDVLRAVDDWAARRGIDVELTGIDYNPLALGYARQRAEGRSRIVFRQARAESAGEGTFDIALCNLFCHHFTDGQLVDVLDTIHGRARYLVINDLHRHPLAWGAIHVLTRLLSRSDMVKNDAPLSVLRAFGRHELRGLLGRTRWRVEHVRWMWAFRLQAIASYGGS